MYDSFSVVPIWMDRNCGRFFNSNSPPKSLKLHSPIWMNSSDSQFNMWNDFDSSFPQLSFFWVNELYPIFKHFNRFNPSILNVFTYPKQSSPISIDSTSVNRLKSIIVKLITLQVQSGILMEVVDESIVWI